MEVDTRVIVLEDAALLSYQLVRSARRSLSALVKEAQVQVRAPRQMPLALIEAFLRQHARALLTEQDRQRRAAPVWGSGAAVLHLGERLSLCLGVGAAHIERRDGHLYVELPQPTDLQQGRRLLQRWRQEQARRILLSRVEHWRTVYPQLAAPLRRVRLRSMRSRWGSCSQAGDMTLNSELVRMSPELIDYVIVHELCHLQVFDHSPRFWALLEDCLPGAKALRLRLRRSAAQGAACF